MKQNIVYVGLDVDCTQYHGSASDKNNSEVIHFKCRPTLKGLVGQLEKLHKHFPGCSFRLCYEASYICYTLRRDLTKNVFALTMITKIGDIKRFTHPRQLVSWIGMAIRGYSSGGNHHRFGITKQGNCYLRTAFI